MKEGLTGILRNHDILQLLERINCFLSQGFLYSKYRLEKFKGFFIFSSRKTGHFGQCRNKYPTIYVSGLSEKSHFKKAFHSVQKRMKAEDLLFSIGKLG